MATAVSPSGLPLLVGTLTAVALLDTFEAKMRTSVRYGYAVVALESATVWAAVYFVFSDATLALATAIAVAFSKALGGKAIVFAVPVPNGAGGARNLKVFKYALDFGYYSAAFLFPLAVTGVGVLPSDIKVVASSVAATALLYVLAVPNGPRRDAGGYFAYAVYGLFSPATAIISAVSVSFLISGTPEFPKHLPAYCAAATGFGMLAGEAFRVAHALLSHKKGVTTGPLNPFWIPLALSAGVTSLYPPDLVAGAIYNVVHAATISVLMQYVRTGKRALATSFTVALLPVGAMASGIVAESVGRVAADPVVTVAVFWIGTLTFFGAAMKLRRTIVWFGVPFGLAGACPNCGSWNYVVGDGDARCSNCDELVAKVARFECPSCGSFFVTFAHAGSSLTRGKVGLGGSCPVCGGVVWRLKGLPHLTSEALAVTLTDEYGDGRPA